MITLQMQVQNLVKENERLTIGAYHPLTKHLNLVAEYSQVESESHRTQSDSNKTSSL